jgi:cellulose synthase (UDP-forming)
VVQKEKNMKSPSRIRGIREVASRTLQQERVVRALALVSLAYGAYWLWWRWTQTLNPHAMVFSLVLVSAETWGWFSAVLFLFGCWRIPERQAPPAPVGKSVDVFITVYDEPLAVVRRTAIGARDIRYPHRTYILDDGKRDDLKQAAEELGIGYIRRVGNAHAKAGNLNFAISVTDGEFILQLDADHFPLPNIIDDILGYFNDSKVAFVQTPQDFYNTDSFTHVVNDQGRELWEENRIFYSLLQAGKDYWGASFFCGCGGMLRRAALESIGGFSTQTIIEDMETSVVLQTHGWRSVYHPRALAFGLSPSSASAFHVQRQRWAQGSMQMLRKFNPLTIRGFTPAQRACYLAANVYPFDGLQKAIFYLAPVVFLLTGAVPVNATGAALLGRLIPYLILSITAFELLTRGTGRLFISERYMMAKFFTYCISLTALFSRKALKFNVTPKGTSDVPFRTFAPQAVILTLSAIAIMWAPIAHARGWVFYETADFRLAYVASAMWAVWNVYFAAHVVRMCLRMRQQRADYRFTENMTVRIRMANTEPMALVASVENLNPDGMSFRSTTRFDPQTPVAFTLPLSTRNANLTGRVVHVERRETPHGAVYTHGVHFDAMDAEDRDAIELHCTRHSVPVWRQRYRQSLDVFARLSERVRNTRSVGREVVQLAAQVNVDDGAAGQTDTGFLEEVSSAGARLLLEQPIPPGTLVRFEVPGTALKGEGRVVSSYALESDIGARFAVGIRYGNGSAPVRQRWPLLTTWFGSTPASPVSDEGKAA